MTLSMIGCRTGQSAAWRGGRAGTGALLALVVLLLSPSACNKEETSSTESSEASDAGPSKKAVDPALAAAVAAASANAPRNAQRVEGGPPPNGVFGPGEADKAIAAGAPPKVALGTDGGQPRIDLAVTPKVGSKWTGSLDLSLQIDPQQPAIPLTLKLGVEVARGKPAANAAAGDNPGSVLVWRVTDASLGTGTRLGPDAAAAFAKIKGAKVEFDLLPNGVVTRPRWDAGKTQSADIAQVVGAVADVLSTLVLPRPATPVGQGGAWMITQRDPFMGLDVVTYRMAQVSSMTPEEATLDVVVKRYATSDDFRTPIVKADAKLTLQEFQAPGNATMHFAKGALLPTRAQLRMQFAALLTVAAGPQAPGAVPQQATVQSQTVANLELAPKSAGPAQPAAAQQPAGPAQPAAAQPAAAQ
jgi:hypothetical protein